MRKHHVFLILILLAIIFKGYILLRYGGKIVENDTAATIPTINTLISTGLIYKNDCRVYNNGFLYQILSSIFCYIMSENVYTIQIIILPITFTLILLIGALYMYSSFSLKRDIITLSAFFFIIEPKLAFYTFRGSHEKVTLFFILLLVAFINKRNVNKVERVILILLILFGFTTTNIFFSTSLLCVIGLVYILNKMRLKDNQIIDGKVVKIILITGSVFVSLMLLYLYPPSLTFIKASRTIVDKFMIILSSTTQHSPEESVYQQVNLLWKSSMYAILFNVFTYFILFLPLFYLFLELFFKKRLPNIGIILEYYIIFTVFFIIAFVYDYYGGEIYVKNASFRVVLIFLPFSILFSSIIINKVKKILIVRKILGGILLIMILLGIPAYSFEPIFSNNIITYTQEEQTMIGWANSFLPLKSTKLWIGCTPRLAYLWLSLYWGCSNERIPAIQEYEMANYIFISNLNIYECVSITSTCPFHVVEEKVKNNIIYNADRVFILRI